MSTADDDMRDKWPRPPAQEPLTRQEQAKVIQGLRREAVAELMIELYEPIQDALIKAHARGFVLGRQLEKYGEIRDERFERKAEK